MFYKELSSSFMLSLLCSSHELNLLFVEEIIVLYAFFVQAMAFSNSGSILQPFLIYSTYFFLQRTMKYKMLCSNAQLGLPILVRCSAAAIKPAESCQTQKSNIHSNPTINHRFLETRNGQICRLQISLFREC